jgi:hypothetical protein
VDGKSVDVANQTVKEDEAKHSVEIQSSMLEPDELPNDSLSLSLSLSLAVCRFAAFILISHED